MKADAKDTGRKKQRSLNINGDTNLSPGRVFEHTLCVIYIHTTQSKLPTSWSPDTRSTASPRHENITRSTTSGQRVRHTTSCMRQLRASYELAARLVAAVVHAGQAWQPHLPLALRKRRDMSCCHSEGSCQCFKVCVDIVGTAEICFAALISCTARDAVVRGIAGEDGAEVTPCSIIVGETGSGKTTRTAAQCCAWGVVHGGAVAVYKAMLTLPRDTAVH